MRYRVALPSPDAGARAGRHGQLSEPRGATEPRKIHRPAPTSILSELPFYRAKEGEWSLSSLELSRRMRLVIHVKLWTSRLKIPYQDGLRHKDPGLGQKTAEQSTSCTAGVSESVRIPVYWYRYEYL